MPLTAQHEIHGRIDVTATTEDLWSEVHQPGSPLTCPGCGVRMSAVQSASRFFRHIRRGDTCTLEEGGRGGESEAHQRVKAAVVAAIRAVPGWTAQPEVGGNGRRADVLATSPNGRQIVWEVQVSYIHRDTAEKRTADWTTAGVAVIWLDMHNRIRELPRLHGTLRKDGSAWTRAYTWAKTKWYPTGHWRPDDYALSEVVRSICDNTITWDGQRWTSDRHRQAASEAARREQERLERLAAEKRRKAEADKAAREQAERERHERYERSIEEARKRQAEAEEEAARLRAERTEKLATDRLALLNELRERGEIDVQTTFRYRHVAAGDVIRGVDGQLWAIRAAQRDHRGVHVEALSPEQSVTGVVDPDETAEVLIPAAELNALAVCRDILGTRVISRSVL